MDNENKSNNFKTGINGTTVGAGTGTLLVVLVQNLPDNAKIKSWLLILAPSISFILKYLFDFLKLCFKKWNLTFCYKKRRKNLIEIINQNKDSEHIELYKKKLIQLEQYFINYDLDKFYNLLNNDNKNFKKKIDTGKININNINN